MSSPSLSALVLAALVAATTATARVGAGDPFPSLSAARLSGGETPDLTGRVVLVDFWASWCAPCRASFAALSRLQKEFGPRGVVIVAVSVDENPAAYAAAVRQWQPPFPALLDTRQQLVRSVEVPAMPSSYLIGRDGRVRFVHSGFHGSVTETEWRAHLAALLTDQPPS
jgi:thiol-disulfide isomerase/thioredoxin